ncbi:MAG: hypothetical protein Q4B28_03350 [bacterium]|nr:hypothetical protein [bacterium]
MNTETEQLIVVHEACILCGVCVRQGYAEKQAGKVLIKPHLPKEQWSLAEGCCPVRAIVRVQVYHLACPARSCGELDSGSLDKIADQVRNDNRSSSE